MKRFIITITLLIALVSSVFAKPKKVDSMDVNGYEAVIWDIGLSQKYVTCEEPVQLFLAEVLLEGPVPAKTIKSDIDDLHSDLQKLIEKYGYYMCFLNGKLFAISYRNNADTVWTILY